ncbi:MAG: Na+/H+ antiporter subunit B [Planctomycetaceae bacterium]|nr:Na+/H+ antiporter subunit B [Planctomycetaceae bacterium]
MKSLILQTAARYLLPLLALYSVLLFLQGHHDPGGGFVGGLIAAASLMLCALAYGVPVARDVLPIQPRNLIGIGLLSAAAAGSVGTLQGKPFLTSAWVKLQLPGFGELELGTPLLFDAGVFLAVLGVTVSILMTLAEEEEEE